MLRWLRRLIGVAGPAYLCPNRACDSRDVLALGVITRPEVGAPWHHVPVGALVECAKCAERYCVTIDGVYSPSQGFVLPKPGRPEPLRPGIPLDALTGDLRLPGEPG